MDGCGSEALWTIERRDDQTTMSDQMKQSHTPVPSHLPMDSYISENKCLFNLNCFYFGPLLHIAVHTAYPNRTEFGIKTV